MQHLIVILILKISVLFIYKININLNYIYPLIVKSSKFDFYITNSMLFFHHACKYLIHSFIPHFFAIRFNSKKFKRLFIITKRSKIEITTFFTIIRTSNLFHAIASYIFMSISIPKQINLDIILLIFIDYLLQGNNRKIYLFCHDQKILPCFFLMFARNIMVLTTRGTRGKK